LESEGATSTRGELKNVKTKKGKRDRYHWDQGFAGTDVPERRLIETKKVFVAFFEHGLNSIGLNVETMFLQFENTLTLKPWKW